jgi:hypothetical protein
MVIVLASRADALGAAGVLVIDVPADTFAVSIVGPER